MRLNVSQKKNACVNDAQEKNVGLKVEEVEKCTRLNVP